MVKLQTPTQTILDLANCTFAFTGILCSLEQLADTTLQGQLFMSLVPECAGAGLVAKQNLRKSLLMARHVIDNVYLWGDEVCFSRKEFVAAMSQDLQEEVRAIILEMDPSICMLAKLCMLTNNNDNKCCTCAF